MVVVEVVEVDIGGAFAAAAALAATFTRPPHQPSNLIRQTSDRSDLHLWPPPYAPHRRALCRIAKRPSGRSATPTARLVFFRPAAR